MAVPFRLGESLDRDPALACRLQSHQVGRACGCASLRRKPLGKPPGMEHAR